MKKLIKVIRCNLLYNVSRGDQRLVIISPFDTKMFCESIPPNSSIASVDCNYAENLQDVYDNLDVRIDWIGSMNKIIRKFFY